MAPPDRPALKVLIGVAPNVPLVCQRSTEQLDLCSGAAIPEGRDRHLTCRSAAATNGVKGPCSGHCAGRNVMKLTMVNAEEGD